MGTSNRHGIPTLGEVIKRRREDLGLSRPDLVRRLELSGIKLPSTTLRNWEVGRRHNDLDWNPMLISALADALETSEYDILSQIGFPVVPEGYTLEDMMLAKRLREAPPEKRKEAVQMLLAIMDRLGF